MAEPDSTRAEKKRAGPLRVARVVFWSFLGVRKAKDRDADATLVTPLQVIVAGVIGAAVFVFCLIMLVRYVTR
jgi:hypothetical protein